MIVCEKPKKEAVACNYRKGKWLYVNFSKNKRNYEKKETNEVCLLKFDV